MSEVAEFRNDVSAWIASNCPDGAKGPGQLANGSTKIELERDVATWLERCAEKGFTAPTWPTEFGGGGLSAELAKVLYEEMGKVNARTPLTGMGMTMIGPTLLEYGTQDQKERHLPKIIRGELQWCQGYSEPNAGSDLAALNTRAEDKGDHYLLNGQKIWTSGAFTADWMFALVRTDFDAPKHEGISFLLLPMDQEGVTVKPIRLISGSSPFCETFLDDAVAAKEDLVGDLNKGWTVGKRLLQYERSASSVRTKKKTKSSNPYATIARTYSGESQGRLADTDARERITRQTMLEKSLQLTVQRVAAESQSGKAPGATTSIFKLVGSTVAKESASLKSELRGTQGFGWEGETFSAEELEATEGWLRDRAVTIYGGTNEVQMNIISKRVLGLPD